jgi:cobalt-zinc-cadmium efflux system outer membrane protein
MKSFLFLLMLLPAAVRSEEIVPLESVLFAVDAGNPELAVLRAEARARAGEARARGAWPELEIGRAWEKTPAGDRMTHWRASQTVPFPGKKSLAAGAARQVARAADDRARQRALELRAEARALAARIARGDAVIARWTDQRDLVSGLMASLRARVAVDRGGMGAGGGPAMDLFSLEAERGRMDNMIRMEQLERDAARFRLNALAGRPSTAPWSIAPGPLAEPPDVDVLLDRAGRENPALAAARATARGGALEKARARLGWAPDIGLMWDEQRMEAERGREAGVSLMLPLWGGPRGENRAAGAMLAAADAERVAMEINVDREVRTEHAEVRTRLDAARSYERDILPASRSALALTRRQYEAGRVDFLRLLESLRSASQAEVEHRDALYEYDRHWGMLEAAVGAPLNLSLNGGQK